MLLYLNHEGHRALHISPFVGEAKSLINQRNMLTVELRKTVKPRGIAVHYETDSNEESERGKKR